jgi:DNA-binding transcriptional LysR family regulator
VREDLVGHRVVDVTASLKSRGSWSTYADTETLASSSFFTNAGSVAAALVASGAAIGLLPSYAYLTNPEFVPIIPDARFKTGLYVNFARDAAERTSVRAMIDHLKNVVFDRRAMPWFADEFAWPDETWRTRFESLRRGLEE